MSDSTRPQPHVIPCPTDFRLALRRRVHEAITEILREEIAAALASDPYERTEDRLGWRNGVESRQVTTEVGSVKLEVPRARLANADGTTAEFQSKVLPRYARRTQRVDEAILGCYLAGANSRRIRKALEPLFGDANLSKSAVSRIVARLKTIYAAWDQRDLSGETYLVLMLDGLNLKVRLARRVVSVPVLAVLGVAEDGSKHLVALRLYSSESSSCWGELVRELQRRGLPDPILVIADGAPGLLKALEHWPTTKLQRCTVHKLRNLLNHAPVHARAEVTRDYHRIVYAKDGLAARKAYDEFLMKWSKLCPPVARSLEEAGSHLMTFYEFPRPMWKALRTTNSLENLNREFRRRTKTQASFASEDAAVTMLYGLLAFGQIKLRKIDGHRVIHQIGKEGWTAAA